MKDLSVMIKKYAKEVELLPADLQHVMKELIDLNEL